MDGQAERFVQGAGDLEMVKRRFFNSDTGVCSMCQPLKGAPGFDGEDIQGKTYHTIPYHNTFKVAPKQGIKEQAEMPDTHTHANTHTHTHAHKSTQPHHKKQLETEIPILYKLCAYTFMRKGFVFRCLDDAVTCHLKDLWPTTPFVLKRTVVFHADI